jgi:hypothetical protein
MNAKKGDDGEMRMCIERTRKQRRREEDKRGKSSKTQLRYVVGKIKIRKERYTASQPIHTAPIAQV